MNKRKPAIPAWEWAVAGLGLLIALGAIGFFALRALQPEDPPRFELTVDSILGTAANITVRNAGDITAAQVVVEGVAAGQPPAEMIFDFVPARSIRSGVLIFESAPTGGIRLRARSYLMP